MANAPRFLRDILLPFLVVAGVDLAWRFMGVSSLFVRLGLTYASIALYILWRSRTEAHAFLAERWVGVQVWWGHRCSVVRNHYGPLSVGRILYEFLFTWMAWAWATYLPLLFSFIVLSPDYDPERVPFKLRMALAILVVLISIVGSMIHSVVAPLAAKNYRLANPE